MSGVSASDEDATPAPSSTVARALEEGADVADLARSLGVESVETKSTRIAMIRQLGEMSADQRRDFAAQFLDLTKDMDEWNRARTLHSLLPVCADQREEAATQAKRLLKKGMPGDVRATILSEVFDVFMKIQKDPGENPDSGADFVTDALHLTSLGDECGNRDERWEWETFLRKLFSLSVRKRRDIVTQASSLIRKDTPPSEILYIVRNLGKVPETLRPRFVELILDLATDETPGITIAAATRGLREIPEDRLEACVGNACRLFSKGEERVWATGKLKTIPAGELAARVDRALHLTKDSPIDYAEMMQIVQTPLGEEDLKTHG